MSTTLAAPPATATPTAKPGIKKLNLGGLATKKAATKTDYPVLADPTGDIAKLTEDLLNETADLEALIGSDGKGGSIGAKKAELRRLAADQYFPHWFGKGDIASSMAAKAADGREVLVAFPKKYKALADESAAAAVLGEELAALFLRQKTAFKLDLDKVPESKLSDVFEGLMGLMKMHGCESALSATQVIVPTDDFHTLRHTKLTPEQNAAFDLVCPIQAMIKTKGRKGAD